MPFCGPGACGPMREAGCEVSTPSERRAFREAMHDPGVRAVMRCSCPGPWELQHQERCHCWPPTEDLGNKEASEQDHQSQRRASSREELCMLLELQKRCRGRHLFYRVPFENGQNIYILLIHWRTSTLSCIGKNFRFWTNCFNEGQIISVNWN